MRASTTNNLPLWRAYLALTKPGIIRGNLLTTTAGFFLASRLAGDVDWPRLVAVLVGLGLIIAAGCVVNNYTDITIDARMARTAKRPLVTGRISGPSSLRFAVLLSAAGSILLLTGTNVLTLALAAFGLFAYVVLYGIAKRRTVYSTLIGSISGAVPPVVGYTAVSGQPDLACLALFTILVTWQMPHFYAIAIYRLADYQTAGLPVLPAVRGVAVTRQRILLWVAAYVGAVSLLTIFGYAGYVYLFVSLLLGLAWFGLGLASYRLQPAAWARQMFLFSLLAVSLQCLAIAFKF